MHNFTVGKLKYMTQSVKKGAIFKIFIFITIETNFSKYIWAGGQDKMQQGRSCSAEEPQIEKEIFVKSGFCSKPEWFQSEMMHFLLGPWFLNEVMFRTQIFTSTVVRASQQRTRNKDTKSTVKKASADVIKIYNSAQIIARRITSYHHPWDLSSPSCSMLKYSDI